MSNNLNENSFLSELDGDLHEAVRIVRDTAPQEKDVRTSVDKMSLLVDEGMDGWPSEAATARECKVALVEESWLDCCFCGIFSDWFGRPPICY